MRPTQCSVASLAALVQFHNWASQDGLCCLRQIGSTLLDVLILFSLPSQRRRQGLPKAVFSPVFLICFRGKWKPVKETSPWSSKPLTVTLGVCRSQAYSYITTELEPIGLLPSVLSGIHVTSNFLFFAHSCLMPPTRRWNVEGQL